MRTSAIARALSAALLAACATTSHDAGPAPETWRTGSAAPAPAASTDERLDIYVASFGLSPTVAKRYPELAASQVGWGIANRIDEALADTRRFRSHESSAEIVEQIEGLMSGARAAVEDADDPRVGGVRYLLYGEVVDVTTERREEVRGLVGRAETVTRITIQLRLLDRSTRQFTSATGTGSAAAPATGRADELDERSVGSATSDAVRRAAEELLRRLPSTTPGSGAPR